MMGTPRTEFLHYGASAVLEGERDMITWVRDLISGSSTILITGPSGVGKTYLGNLIRQQLRVEVVHLDRYCRNEGHLHLLDYEAMNRVWARIYEGWADNILRWIPGRITHIMYPVINIMAFRRINRLKAQLARKGSWAHCTWVSYWEWCAQCKPSDYEQLALGGLRMLVRALPGVTVVVYMNAVSPISIARGWHEIPQNP
jgi:hypothetical protein